MANHRVRLKAARINGGADTFATRSVLTNDFLEQLTGGGEGRVVLTSWATTTHARLTPTSTAAARALCEYQP